MNIRISSLLILIMSFTLSRPQINTNLQHNAPSGSRGVFPEITLGSYATRNNDEPNRYDRFGPPYADGSDEDDVDIKNNPVVNVNSRNNNNYNSNNNNYNNNNNNNYNTNNNNYNNRQNNNEDNGGRFDEKPNYFNNNQSNNYYEQRNKVNVPKLKRLLADIDHTLSIECFNNVAAQWNFETNVNEVTQIEAIEAQQRYSLVQRRIWEQLKTIDKEEIFDQNLYRQVQLISTIGVNALPPDQLDRYNRILNDMLAIYNTASICAYEQPFQCGLQLNPDLKEIMAKSRDWNELQHTWIEWRRKSGSQLKPLFEQIVMLTNEAAKFNNFTNAAEYWMFPYESLNFKSDIEQVWADILPLYELLHSYVRKKLRDFYGPDKISKNAPLPEHILGNMNGQSWSKILDIIIPYPGRNFLDVTPAMQNQGYNPLIMFQIAEEFFVSMNMTRLPQDFWLNSVLEEVIDRPVLCQPSAWDFCNAKDFRIKMCTKVTHADMITVHQQLAHLHYFSNYRGLPKVFRDGANPGFHDAVGNAITLSVASPKHLQKLGLITKSIDDAALDINYLFSLAIDQLTFLPYALALETWRWDIFNKNIRKDQYNCHWWFLRERYGGIKPPILRSELDFDAGSKYHVAANIPYIRYFVGIVLQFQLHRTLCSASKEYVQGDSSKPLHNCDLHGHPEAGDILRDLMSKGSSEPWQKTLLETTGEPRLDATALLEFFKPLEDWLRNENLRNQELSGWTYDGDYCKYSFETANLQVDGGFYNIGTRQSWKTTSELFMIVIVSQIVTNI